MIADDPRFGIGPVIGQILGQLDPSADPEGAVQAWREAAGSVASAFKDGDLQLLAVVNRSDLAHPVFDQSSENGSMEKVEIRFEYAVIQGPQQSKAFAIVEAELKELSKARYKEYVASWLALDNPSASIVHDLVVGHLQTHGVKRARIRISGDVGNVWELRQFDYSSSGFKISPLSRELPERSRNGFEPTSCLKDWIGISANIHHVLASDYEFDNSGISCYATDVLFKLPTERAAILSEGIDPLSLESHVNCGECSPAIRSKVAQLVLVNACSRCHSEVHDAQFFHLTGRKPGEQSQLSSFLTGKPHADPGASFYSDTPLVEQHAGSHNDLLRRHLFAKKVSSLDPLDPQWMPKLQDLWSAQAH